MRSVKERIGFCNFNVDGRANGSLERPLSWLAKAGGGKYQYCCTVEKSVVGC